MAKTTMTFNNEDIKPLRELARKNDWKIKATIKRALIEGYKVLEQEYAKGK